MVWPLDKWVYVRVEALKCGDSTLGADLYHTGCHKTVEECTTLYLIKSITNIIFNVAMKIIDYDRGIRRGLRILHHNFGVDDNID